MTEFSIPLMVLLVIHTAVCFGADRIFASRDVAPPGTPPVESTTPEQQARGERVFVSVTGRTERPAALVFYAIAGYIGLLAAAAWGVFTAVRSQST